MKIYLYLTLGFFFLFGTFTSIAQTCGSGSITLSSQAEVDDFQATYGPCNTMGSNLTISGADITDLTPLAGVTGYVSILRIHSNPMLQSLAGINFTGMDVLSIKDNAALPNFEGLNLSAVGLAVIEIDNNDALTDISGFTGSIFSQITVKNNDQLVNLLGLENADDLSTVQIENNDALESLSGLNVRDVTGSVSIKGNEILSDLQGAERLRLVPDGLFIQNNPSLMSLQGLSGLRIVGTLRITNNPMLTDISAIGGITSGFGQYRIKDNTNLSDCCVIEVLKPLQNFVASFDISNNNMGCNSETEVTTYCEDADGDGFNIIEGDCNDDPMADGALVYPGAVEYCDGLDNDCDELVDVDDPDLVYDNDLIVFCKDATVQLDAMGMVTITSDDVVDYTCTPGGTSVEPSLSANAFNCGNIGENTVTVTVSVIDFPTTTCEATITIEDNVAPDAQCQNVTVDLDAGGSAALIPAQVNNSSSDACGGLTFGLDQTDFNCDDVDSPVTVTLTVSDANSNSNTCTAQVTVEDVTPPVPVCQDQTITFNGESTIAVLFTDLLDAANSTDNCEVLVIAEEEPDVLISCDLAGTSIPVTVHVEDLSGNPASCTSTITVDGLPCGWQDMGGIGCQDDNNTSSYDGVGSYDLLANNCAPEFPYAGDQIAFLSTELCGDGEIIAEVTNVQGTGYAGVMMRDDLSPNAPMISMGTNRVNFVRRQVRILASYPAWPQQILSMDKFWVRIVRNGNQFQAFASADGNAWIPYLNQQVFMNNNCIQVGLFTYSEKPGTPLSASFSNVFVTGQNNLQQQSQNAFAGTNLIQKQDINIFPNPTKDVFYIDFSSYLGQGVEMRLFNGTGQAVHYSKYDEAPGLEQLDVSRLVPGIYNLIITFEEERIVKRVVVGR